MERVQVHLEDFCKQKSAPAKCTLWSNRPLYQSWGAEPSVPTLGTASELVRYDGLAFLYAFPGLLPPFPPRFRRITRFVLRAWAVEVCKLFAQQPHIPIFSFFPRGYRVRRVMRVSVYPCNDSATQ